MKIQAAVVGMISAIALVSVSFPAQADTRKAYCEYFPIGESQAKVAMPCFFSMRQGAITIRWEDGVSDYFRPIPNRRYTYTDERGGIVYQQIDEDEYNGNSKRIFKMENGSIYVWGS